MDCRNSVAVLFILAIWWTGNLYAQASIATLIAPAPGQGEIPASMTFAWEAVDDVDAYYLYVGTGVGAKDLVDSGETSVTSRRVYGLPQGTIVYVRLWTKTKAIWRYNDYDFTVAVALTAQLLTPSPAAPSDPSTLFTWTAVRDAQAYYLYVGTKPGLKDIVDSRETLATSRRVDGLPEGRIVYVRLWTKTKGVWRYNDYELTIAAALTARLLTPSAGAPADPTTPFTWTAVSDAQAYYLYVGTKPGLKDIVDTGALSSTSYVAHPLDGGATVFVTLWTKIGNQWRYRDYEIQTAPVPYLITPKRGSRDALPDTELAWTKVEGADAYYVYVGSAPGRNDLLSSGELPLPAFTASTLPGASTAYVRVWARKSQRWRYSDATFDTAPVSRFITPRTGSIGTTSPLTLKWAEVGGADAYRVELGTTPHGSDLLVTGNLTSTEFGPIDLPPLPAVYGRIWTLHGGVWRQGTTVFATQRSVTAPYFVYPANGGVYTNGRPYEWTSNGLEKHYRLMLGTYPGASDVYDSGPIHSTRHFVFGLTPAVRYFATIETSYVSGVIQRNTIEVTAADGPDDFDTLFKAAMDAASDVTDMALNDIAAAGTELERVTKLRGLYRSYCTDYRDALLALLSDMNLGLRARGSSACLVPNSYDCHTLVEIEDASTGRWILLDPMFGVVPHRASDGERATSIDMSAAARNRDWTAISYQSVNPASQQLLDDYYLDYPTLFVNVYDPPIHNLIDPLQSVIDMYDVIGSNADGRGRNRFLAAQCVGEDDLVTVVVDDVAQQYACTGPDRLTHVFLASTANTDAEEARLVEPRRYVFGVLE